MFQHVLVPLDGSERAEHALPVATRIARVGGGSVLLVQVVNPPIDYGGGLAPVPLVTEQVVESEMAQASDYLKRVASSPALAGIETRTEALFGETVQALLSAVSAYSVNLVVMDNHGRTGLERWALARHQTGAARHRSGMNQRGTAMSQEATPNRTASAGAKRPWRPVMERPPGTLLHRGRGLVFAGIWLVLIVSLGWIALALIGFHFMAAYLFLQGPWFR